MRIATAGQNQGALAGATLDRSGSSTVVIAWPSSGFAPLSSGNPTHLKVANIRPLSKLHSLVSVRREPGGRQLVARKRCRRRESASGGFGLRASDGDPLGQHVSELPIGCQGGKLNGRDECPRYIVRPDETHLAGGGIGSLLLWNVETGQVKKFPRGSAGGRPKPFAGGGKAGTRHAKRSLPFDPPQVPTL